MIAFLMAVDSPKSVRSLIIVNSGPEMILRTPVERQAIEARYKIVRELGMSAMAKMIAEPFSPSLHRPLSVSDFNTRSPRTYLDSLSAING